MNKHDERRWSIIARAMLASQKSIIFRPCEAELMQETVRAVRLADEAAGYVLVPRKLSDAMWLAMNPLWRAGDLHRMYAAAIEAAEKEADDE